LLKKLLLGAGIVFASTQTASAGLTVTKLGTYHSGQYATLATEISAYDRDTKRIFIANVADGTLDILDIADPTNPTLIVSVDMHMHGHHPLSVAVKNGLVAVGIQANVKTDPGAVAFYDTDGNPVAAVTVSSMPDMVTFTPDGKYVLAAIEGEPADDLSVDPEGAVAIIDVQGAIDQLDVVEANFLAFNYVPLDPSVRVNTPGSTPSQNFEPEYITVSSDSKKAYVTLQESNAVATVDLVTKQVTAVAGLGFKDHSLPGNAFDASDRDNGSGGPAIHIQNWPVFGMYQPDGVALLSGDGIPGSFLVMANEGDSREYSAFNETARVSSLTLDPVAFPNAAALKNNAALGRLTITKSNGDTDGDGDFDQIYALGARSFSIRALNGAMVWDSGDGFERKMAELFPTGFNSDNAANNSFDTRSDNKGPEPEGLAVGKVAKRQYAFVGLERMSGVIVYDITNPYAPTYATYINNRDFAGDAALGTAGDLGPENMIFVKADDSPTNRALLITTNEVSGTVTIFELR
jgi:2',3'-cyclic-nucleotide 2'-phosphodiesterase/3'-nucleotidase/5'-nucleotidase